MGSFGAGFTFGLQNSARQTSQKQTLSDEEHAQQLSDANNSIAAIQQKMGQVGPNHPDYAGLQNQLQQVVSDRTALFHPDTPGGMARLGKAVWDHHVKKDQHQQVQEAAVAVPSFQLPGAMGAPGATVPGTTGPVVSHPASTPAEMKARMAQDLSFGVPTGPMNPVQQRIQQRVQAGLTQDQALQAERVAAGIEAKPVGDKPDKWTPVAKSEFESDGRYYRMYFDPENGEQKQVAMPEDYKPQPGFGALKVGSLGEFLVAAYGPTPTPQQEIQGRRQWAAANAGTTVGSRMIMVPQPDGTVRAMQVQTTSSKQFGAGAAPAERAATPGAPTPGAVPTLHRRGDGEAEQVSIDAAAPTPAAMKTKVTAARKKPAPAAAAPPGNADTTHNDGKVHAGEVVGGRMSPSATKAQGAYDDAQRGYMDVAQAVKDPNSLNDKGVILAWLRGRVNRVTASEISAVNSLGGAQIAVENGAARVLRGEMSPQQRQWFLKSAKANLDIATAVGSKYPGFRGAQQHSGGPKMVTMRAPNGLTKPVPADQVEHYKSIGGTVVQ